MIELHHYRGPLYLLAESISSYLAIIYRSLSINARSNPSRVISHLSTELGPAVNPAVKCHVDSRRRVSRTHFISGGRGAGEISFPAIDRADRYADLGMDAEEYARLD